MIDFCIINTPIGKLQIESNLNILTKISFNINRVTSIPSTSIKHSLAIQQTIEELNEYFFSDREIFTINYRLEVSPFYKKVLKKVSKIPFGTTQSYKKIAKQLNNKNAYRAVGSANANNPFPIIYFFYKGDSFRVVCYNNVLILDSSCRKEIFCIYTI